MVSNKKVVLDQARKLLGELRGDISAEAHKIIADLPSTASGGFYEVALQSFDIASRKIAKRGYELSEELFCMLAALHKLSDKVDELDKSYELIYNSYEANYELFKSIKKLPD